MSLFILIGFYTKRLFILINILILASSLWSQNQDIFIDSIRIEKHLQKGDSLEESGKYDQAIKEFNLARRIAVNKDQWPAVIKCDSKKGRIFDLLGQQEIYESCVLNALQLCKKHTDEFHPVRGNIYLQMGGIYISKQKSDSVIHFLRNAKIIFELTENWKEYATCDILLAVNAFYSKDFKNMEVYLTHAMKLQEQYSEKIQPTVFNLFGVLYSSTGEFEKALSIILQSILSRLETEKLTKQDSLALITYYNNVGVIYKQKEDFENSIRYFQQALNILEKMADKDTLGTIEVYSNMGVAYSQLGEEQNALESFLLALNQPLQKSPRSTQIKILSYQHLAYHYLQNSQNAKAQITLNTLFELHKKSSYNQENTHRIQGLLHYSSKEYLSSEKAFLKSIELEQQYPSPDIIGIANLYNHLGKTFAKQGKHEVAIDAYIKGFGTLDVDISEANIDDVPNIDELETDKLSFLRLMIGKIDVVKKSLSPLDTKGWKLLLENINLAIEVLHEINQSYLHERTQSNLESFSIFESGIDACWQLFLHTGDEKYVKRAFELSEKSKAFILQSRLKKMKAIRYGDVPDEWIARDQQLRRDMAFYENKIFQEKHRPKQDSLKLAHWEEKSFHLHREYEAFNDSLKRQYPKYTRLARDPKVASISEIQNELKDDKTAVIVYFYGDESQYAFRITRNELSLIPLSLDETFFNSFQALLTSLKDKYAVETQAYEKAAFNSWTQHSFFCFQRLMEGILPDEMEHIIVVPDGPLAYFPFELLLTESPENNRIDYRSLPFLLKKSAISYEYAASLLINKNPSKKNIQGLFAGFGPETKESSTSPNDTRENFLKYAKSEVDAIQAVIGGKKFLGSQATEENFKNFASDFQLLHLATHGNTDDVHPENSFLSFYSPEDSEDGKLHLNEIYSLSLQANLSVLSACNTGTGPLDKGEGIISLAHAFKYAGSENIVMSLWQVDDAMTQDLMLVFYANLAEGMSLTEAIRQAKLSYLATSPRPHPFFWGAFVLIGNDTEITTTSKPDNEIWLIVSLFSLLVAGFILRNVWIKAGRKYNHS